MELTNEFKSYKETSLVDNFEAASSLHLEIITAKLESQDIYSKIDFLMKGFEQTDTVIKQKFEKFMQDSANN